jgi:hypothetical protein
MASSRRQPETAKQYRADPPAALLTRPQLNVSEYPRANRLPTGVWDSYNEILDACCEAWNCSQPTQPHPHAGMVNGQS